MWCIRKNLVKTPPKLSHKASTIPRAFCLLCYRFFCHAITCVKQSVFKGGCGCERRAGWGRSMEDEKK